MFALRCGLEYFFIEKKIVQQKRALNKNMTWNTDPNKEKRLIYRPTSKNMGTYQQKKECKA